MNQNNSEHCKGPHFSQRIGPPLRGKCFLADTMAEKTNWVPHFSRPLREVGSSAVGSEGFLNHWRSATAHTQYFLTNRKRSRALERPHFSQRTREMGHPECL
jgi:hypothetical protein